MGFFSSLKESLPGGNRALFKGMGGGHVNKDFWLNTISAGAHSVFIQSIATTKFWWDKLFPLPDEPQADITGNKSSNVQKRPVIYGERGKVGGVRVYINTTGANNEYLYMVLDISEGEIEAIDNIYINNIISTDSKFSGLVTFTMYLGTDFQTADPDLVATFPDWTSAHQLKGIAYLVCKFKYSSDAFSGFPTITCDIRGKKVYDPRTGLTEYSVTPALHLRDYFISKKYGKGAPSALINDTDVATAADYQEQLVVESDAIGAPNVPLVTSNLFLPTDTKIIDSIRLLLAANRAGFPKIDGKHRLVVERDEASVFDFNVDNIIGGWTFAKGELNSRLNEAEVTFTNKLLEWKDDTFQVTSATLLAEDNNFTLSNSIAGLWITDPYHAQDLANLAIKQSRQQLTCSFVASPEAINVIPRSIVTVTHGTPGWDHKTFRVQDCTLMPYGLVGVSLVEHEPTVYDRDVPVEAPAPPDTNLPDPENVLPPTGISLFSGDNELLLAQDGTVISRIKAVWSAPVGYPYVASYDIEYKKSTEIDWIPAPPTSARTGTIGYVGPVDDGETYQIRVRTIAANGMASGWLTSSSHTVIGKLAPPPDVDTFTVLRQPDGTRVFDWTLNFPPPDLAGFRVKYKLSSGQLWADLLPLHSGLLTAAPFESNQLAAGTYTIGIVAVDTSGNESQNPKIISSTLGDPRIAGSVYSTSVQAVDPIWPGTKTNCYTDPAAGILLATDSKDWDSFAVDGTTWDTWTSWARSPATSFTYEHPSATTAIDLGALISFNPLISVDGVGTLTTEEQHSDDNIVFTAWAVAGPLVTTRYVRLRVTVAEPVLLGTLSKMDINLAADPVNEYINDVVTSAISSPAGVFRLPIVKSYATITQVTLAIQNVTGGWTWALMDKDPALGPLINIYNGSGVLADATIDAVVRGI